MLIVLGGLPGCGKTTLARQLARRLGAVHVRIDSIEQAIRQSGIRVVSLDDAGYRAGQAVAADNLRLGQRVIADSVNPLPVTREAWRATARAAGVAAFEVEITCSDAAEHRQRVETRQADLPGLRLPSWDDVLGRAYAPWPEASLRIDTARQAVSESVARLEEALLARLSGGA
jgi:predicted kinase